MGLLTVHMHYLPSLFGQYGWILVKVFFCVFLRTETKLILREMQNKDGPREHSFCMPNAGNQSTVKHSDLRQYSFKRLKVDYS